MWDSVRGRLTILHECFTGEHVGILPSIWIMKKYYIYELHLDILYTAITRCSIML